MKSKKQNKTKQKIETGSQIQENFRVLELRGKTQPLDFEVFSKTFQSFQRIVHT